MMPKELLDPQMSQALDGLRSKEEPFAIATVVRTAGATAAKPGTKALLSADGVIQHGWLGGGCTKSAVAAAARQAIEDGTPQLVSIMPEDQLDELGVSAGDQVEGVQMARNGCPSEGTIVLFVEPWIPRPELVVFGTSPVAEALSAIAPTFNWDVQRAGVDDGLAMPVSPRRRVIVVATQGQGDLAALTIALAEPSDYVAFVGSRKKYASLGAKLAAQGCAQDLIDAVQAPAGLDIGAVTPEEIALSILAELTRVLRRAQTGAVRDA